MKRPALRKFRYCLTSLTSVCDQYDLFEKENKVSLANGWCKRKADFPERYSVEHSIALN